MTRFRQAMNMHNSLFQKRSIRVLVLLLFINQVVLAGFVDAPSTTSATPIPGAVDRMKR